MVAVIEGFADHLPSLKTREIGVVVEVECHFANCVEPSWVVEESFFHEAIDIRDHVPPEIFQVKIFHFTYPKIDQCSRMCVYLSYKTRLRER